MEATRLLGINSYFVAGVSFAIGIALAGTAGVVMASVYSFDPNYGFVFAIKALVVLALGGIGNVWGALTAGLLLGVIESVAAYYVGAAGRRHLLRGVHPGAHLPAPRPVRRPHRSTEGVSMFITDYIRGLTRKEKILWVLAASS